jgi:putative peptidoglycan lipid II flippase
MLAGIGVSHGAKEISLVLVTALGGLVYVALAFLTRAITTAEVKGLLRRTGK